MKAYVVTGTDTGIGKTVFAAGLTGRLQAHYWKPIQSGLEEETDSETVARLSGRPVLPEAYRLSVPASPHISAAAEGVRIDDMSLALPKERPLVIEGAGGLMVPLNDRVTFLDVFARWGLPVILVARTSLGTINHSLLSIAALRARDIPIGGILFSGDAHEENEAIIPRLSGVWSLGRLPRLDSLDPARLHLAMQAHVDIGAIEALLA